MPLSDIYAIKSNWLLNIIIIAYIYILNKLPEIKGIQTEKTEYQAGIKTNHIQAYWERKLINKIWITSY